MADIINDKAVYVCIDCGDRDVMGVYRSLVKAEECKESLAPAYKIRIETSELED